MDDDLIKADTFMLQSHDLQIFRIQEPETATLLWICEEDAVDHLQKLKSEEFQVKKGR